MSRRKPLDKSPERMRKVFGWNLKYVMSMRGKNQRQLGDEIGVLKHQISRYATGDALPTMRIMSKICINLDTTLDYLTKDRYVS